MTRTRVLLALSVLLAASATEARPAPHAAKPQPNAAIKARQITLDGFNARMSRLDALMGAGSSTASRSRSAEAGR